MPLPLYCRIVNARNFARGRRIRLEPFEGEHIFKVRDATGHLFVCRRSRHLRYKRGVHSLLEKLAQAYHLDKVPHRPEGLLIDCGANIGELGVWARAKGWDYLAFEPEPLEARCADLNVFDGNRMTIRKALWNRATTLAFSPSRKPPTVRCSTRAVPTPDLRSKHYVSTTRLISWIAHAPLFSRWKVKGRNRKSWRVPRACCGPSISSLSTVDRSVGATKRIRLSKPTRFSSKPGSSWCSLGSAV